MPIPVPNVPVEPPQPIIVPPKYLWDTQVNIIHSMRMIGDEFFLSVLQKDLLCDICRCESGFKLTAKLVNSPTSIDRGLFQWNNKYHPEITDAIAYDPEKATRLACQAIKSGKNYWPASQKCWNKTGKYDFFTHFI